MSRSVVILTGIPIILGVFFYLSVAWSVFGFPSMWEAWLLPLAMFVLFLPALGLLFTLSGIQRVQWIAIAILIGSMCMMFLFVPITFVSVIGLITIALVVGLGYAIALRRIRAETEDRISYRPIKIIPSSLRIMGGVNLILVAFLVFLALQQNINLGNRELQLPQSVFKTPVQVLDPAISAVIPAFSADAPIAEIIGAQIDTSNIGIGEVPAGAEEQITQQKETFIRKRIDGIENGLGISIENTDTVPQILQAAANQRLASLLQNNSGAAAGTASLALLFALWSIFMLMFPVFWLMVRIEQALMFMTGMVTQSSTTVENQVVKPYIS